MQKYQEYYKPFLRQFCRDLTQENSLDDFAGIPCPFTPEWGKRYEQSKTKLAIIGLETRGWGNLPENMKEIQTENWDSIFDFSEFQNLNYLGWMNQARNRFSYWGGVLYFLAHLYGIQDWTTLRDGDKAEILNSFAWGNVSAIERWASDGIDKELATREHHAIARSASYNLNDFQHLNKTLAPDVSVIMAGRGDTDTYLRNTEISLLWDEDNVRCFQNGDSLIFNIPHPRGLMYIGGDAQDRCVDKIRQTMINRKHYIPLLIYARNDGVIEKLTEQVVANKITEYFKTCTQKAATPYDAVAMIALELKKQEAYMSVPVLCQLLNQYGFRTKYDTEYSGGRGSYRMVACAYHQFELQGEQDIADAIAYAFTNSNGDYAYE